jgi:hypothetical protein
VSRLTEVAPPGGRRRTPNPGWPRGAPPVGASRRDRPPAAPGEALIGRLGTGVRFPPPPRLTSRDVLADASRDDASSEAAATPAPAQRAARVRLGPRRDRRSVGPDLRHRHGRGDIRAMARRRRPGGCVRSRGRSRGPRGSRVATSVASRNGDHSWARARFGRSDRRPLRGRSIRR